MKRLMIIMIALLFTVSCGKTANNESISDNENVNTTLDSDESISPSNENIDELNDLYDSADSTGLSNPEDNNTPSYSYSISPDDEAFISRSHLTESNYEMKRYNPVIIRTDAVNINKAKKEKIDISNIEYSEQVSIEYAEIIQLNEDELKDTAFIDAYNEAHKADVPSGSLNFCINNFTVSDGKAYFMAQYYPFMGDLPIKITLYEADIESGNVRVLAENLKSDSEILYVVRLIAANSYLYLVQNNTQGTVLCRLDPLTMETKVIWDNDYDISNIRMSGKYFMWDSSYGGVYMFTVYELENDRIVEYITDIPNHYMLGWSSVRGDKVTFVYRNGSDVVHPSTDRGFIVQYDIEKDTAEQLAITGVYYRIQCVLDSGYCMWTRGDTADPEANTYLYDIEKDKIYVFKTGSMRSVWGFEPSDGNFNMIMDEYYGDKPSQKIVMQINPQSEPPQVFYNGKAWFDIEGEDTIYREDDSNIKTYYMVKQ